MPAIRGFPAGGGRATIGNLDLRRMTITKNKNRFTRFAKATAKISGTPPAFASATALIVVWGISGPIFGYSDTWQLVINTGTTIVTFLMVFLIQNTQNRDSEAMHIKLDELIRAVGGAHNALLDLEDLEEEDLDRIRKDYEKLAEKARNASGRKQRKVPARPT